MGHSHFFFLHNIERSTPGGNLVSRFVFYLHGRSLCTVITELCRSFCTTFYCSYFKTQYKKATFSKLHVAYNKVYRKILSLCRRSSASEMFETNTTLNFETLMRKSIFVFTSRLSISNNAIICTNQNF